MLEGGVAALANNGTVNVPKGFGTRVAQGQAPSPPVELLLAPDLATIPALIERTPIRFRWAANPTAAGYRVQIEREKLAGAIFDEALFRAPEASFPDLPDGRYALRVRAIDANGLEGYNALSEPFAQLDTPTFEKGQINFKWSEPLPGQKFRVQVARDEGFHSTVHDVTQTANYLTLKSPGAGRYFVRVGVIDPDGFVAPYGPTQQLDVARNYWPLLLFLPLLLL